MGAVQVQILGPEQGSRMAPRATSTATSTATRSMLATSLLSLLLLPLCQALPQPAESQGWLARSTCVLDALAPGGVVDSQKFNDCMDCWRSSSDESLQTATTCLSSLPQFCKEDEAEDGSAGPLLCVELDGDAELGAPTALPHRPHRGWHLLWVWIHLGLRPWSCRSGNCLQCSNC